MSDLILPKTEVVTVLDTPCTAESVPLPSCVIDEKAGDSAKPPPPNSEDDGTDCFVYSIYIPPANSKQMAGKYCAGCKALQRQLTKMTINILTEIMHQAYVDTVVKYVLGKREEVEKPTVSLRDQKLLVKHFESKFISMPFCKQCLINHFLPLNPDIKLSAGLVESKQKETVPAPKLGKKRPRKNVSSTTKVTEKLSTFDDSALPFAPPPTKKNKKRTNKKSASAEPGTLLHELLNSQSQPSAEDWWAAGIHPCDEDDSVVAQYGSADEKSEDDEQDEEPPTLVEEPMV